ncbi:MAG: hypothetical protein LUQ26_01785 [Methylococcaceae bacterium]|nr:hypothetical protein [Methylococcaceae bacterium]
MKFIIKADCVFEAKNIDDAFGRLADYFIAISCRQELPEPLIVLGSIEIEPVEEK